MYVIGKEFKKRRRRRREGRGKKQHKAIFFLKIIILIETKEKDLEKCGKNSEEKRPWNGNREKEGGLERDPSKKRLRKCMRRRGQGGLCRGIGGAHFRTVCSLDSFPNSTVTERTRGSP